MRVIKARCEQCGTMYPVWSDEIPIEEWDDTVSYGVDPFDSEINGDYTEMWLCGHCSNYNAQCI